MSQDFRDYPSESQQHYFGIDGDKPIRSVTSKKHTPIQFESVPVDHNGKPIENMAKHICKCLGIEYIDDKIIKGNK